MTSDKPAETPARSERQVISYLAFTGIMLALGIDIALPAFDQIGPDVGLEVGSNRISIIITMYFIGMGIGQLLWGPLSDAYGRQVAMRAGMALYVVAALATAFAPTFQWMLISRLIWGFGAAAAAGLRPAIARDLYAGDRMARVMSLVMAIFMIGPILAPLLGEVILLVAPWPGVFLFCAAAGLAQLAWSAQFGETLPSERRRTLDFSTTSRAFKQVLTTRRTIGYTMALSFSYGSFYIFLGSSQPIMDTIYGRSDQFALAFGVAGIFMAAAFLTITRLIERFGAVKTSRVAMIGFVALAAIQLALVVNADGTPSFWIWISTIILINLFGAPLGPVCFTLGLEPMGDLAGTAAGVMGFFAMLSGAGLAAIIDAAIDTTVTPMALAYLLYGSLALLSLYFAEWTRSESSS